METNLTIVRADKKGDENTTRRMFLNGDTDNDRQFFWPISKLPGAATKTCFDGGRGHIGCTKHILVAASNIWRMDILVASI